jgi:small subunit ribosomal protein S1
VRSEDEDEALNAALSGADLDHLMIGDRSLRVGRRLEDGSRHPGKVIKVHNANVFISLGGPDEGVVSILQFENPPEAGQPIEVLIRGFNREEGLYDLAIPGEAIAVNDWDDLQEGAIVEAKVESANTGGVECKVGNVRGFIPISQLAEYRIETAADYIGQKLLCVITEANPRRGNLVLSHRAVLERDKESKRKERMASIQVGDQCEGTVRKVTDFGAFVDIGGLDGLIHITQLSWEKIKHPSEVIKEGDTVQVRIEKIDPTTGKIGLSYRSAQDNPWNDVEARFPIGAVVKGVVSRLANFGAFVKLSTGIEGLIHISELAHRRVSNVSQILQEGQDVEVKILTVEADAQRIGLSLRATQAKPESENKSKSEPEPEEQRRSPAVKKFQGTLKGGTGNSGGGELFGLKF